MNRATIIAAATERPIPVRVNGVTIPRDVIAREVQHHPAPKPIAAWQSATRALVVRELLLQEARRLGIAAKPLTDADGRRETDDEALIRSVVDQQVLTPVPDEETCRRYYGQNTRRFRSPDIFEASHILLAARKDDVAAYEVAGQRARELLLELTRQPDRFGALATLHSDCPSKAVGGNLGQIAPGQTTPEFEDALGHLPVGAFSDPPVASRYGFHVIRLDRKIEGRQLPFEMVADRIAAYLGDHVRRRAIAQYIAKLASEAVVEGVELAGKDSMRVH